MPDGRLGCLQLLTYWGTDGYEREGDRGRPAPFTRTIAFRGLLGALGVVCGVIGTSLLYAPEEAVKAASAGASPTPEAVLGAVSVILWL